jgi:hypothetical protein
MGGIEVFYGGEECLYAVLKNVWGLVFGVCIWRLAFAFGVWRYLFGVWCYLFRVKLFFKTEFSSVIKRN